MSILPSRTLCSGFLILTLTTGLAQDSHSSFAIRFSGTGSGQTDRITIPVDNNSSGTDRSAPADIGAGAFTIEFWLRGELADNPADSQIAGSHPANLWINGNMVIDRDIWPQGAPTGDRDYGISLAQGRVMFGTGQNPAAPSPDGENTLVGTRNVLDGTWHHVACIRDISDGSKRIVVDGELDATVAAVSDDDLSFPNNGVPINAASNCDCNHALVLGAEKHDAGAAFPSFNGYFDELRIWKAALSQECIQRYRHRILINPSPGRDPVDGFPDLVANYRFEEGSGTGTTDSSGANNGRSNYNGVVEDGTAGRAEWVSAATDSANTAPVWNGTDLGGQIKGKLLVSGLTRPLFVCSPPGDPDRVFIVEQRDGSAIGRVKIFKKSTGRLNARDFLSISGVNTSNEEGLLGLAFHPNFASNGFVYVYFSDNVGGRRSFLRRYTTSHLHPGGLHDPDRVDPASATPIIDFAQPQSNHNGGWIAFRAGDAESYLYLGTGDGGSFDDNGSGHTSGTGNAQDITNNLLGKMLRLNVDGDDFPTDSTRNYAIPPTNRFVNKTGDDEIWLYGLRNPWRCCFDKLTGDLWIADVGQNAREEIDFRAAHTPDDADGNYGWRLREGFLKTPGSVGGNRPSDNVEPILEYVRSSGSAERVNNGSIYGTSITGGHVYRGPQAGLQGLYFFADDRSDRVWSMRYCGSTVTELTERTSELISGVVSNPEITSFGEDGEGKLYYCSRSGDIVEIVIDDGPWNAWRNTQFDASQIADEILSGPLGNPDRDPRSNLAEFFVNSDPTTTDGDLAMQVGTTTTGPDDFFTFSLTRDPQSFGVVKIIGETSGDLTQFFSISRAQILTDSDILFRFRDSVPMSSAPNRFGRFKLELE